MATYGVSVMRADESYGSATIYYYEAPTVYVEITAINSSNSKWRIRGRASLGDDKTYLEGQGLGEFEFDSSDNKSYIFQIQNWNGDWVNTTNMYGENEENSIFNVEFDSGSGDSGDDDGEDDGGSSGGGSSDSGFGIMGEDSPDGSYYILVRQGEGTKLTVTRTYVDSEEYFEDGDYIGELVNGELFEDDYGTWRKYQAWNDDYFTIEAEALSGYTIDRYTIDGVSCIFYVSGMEYNKGYDGNYAWNFDPGDFGEVARIYTTATKNGGSSGDSGGSSSGTTSDTVTAGGVTAKATWTSSGKVTVTITSLGGYNAGLYWRVKLAGTSGNTGIQIPETNSTSASFNATDGETYIFQICPSGTWTNDGGNASKFTVNFDSGSGGDSGGDSGGGNTTTARTLYVNQGEGTILKIRRIWPEDRKCWSSLETGEPVYCDGEDTFYVEVTALDGYELDYYEVEGRQVPYILENFKYLKTDSTDPNLLYYQLEYDADATVTSTATPISVAYIYSKNSGWERYTPYIYNQNSGWERYTPYIYNGSNWERYS